MSTTFSTFRISCYVCLCSCDGILCMQRNIINIINIVWEPRHLCAWCMEWPENILIHWCISTEIYFHYYYYYYKWNELQALNLHHAFYTEHWTLNSTMKIYYYKFIFTLYAWCDLMMKFHEIVLRIFYTHCAPYIPGTLIHTVWTPYAMNIKFSHRRINMWSQSNRQIINTWMKSQWTVNKECWHGEMSKQTSRW